MVSPFVDRSFHSVAEEIEPDTGEIVATSTDRFVRELAPLFPEGSWELDQPMVLRSPQATILLREFEQLNDESIQVRPCTLVFWGKDEQADSATAQVEETAEKRPSRRGPIIMQAPEGAILRFDEAIDLSNGVIGKPVEGRLVGPIRIVSPTGPDTENLVINTSEVVIEEQRIWTPENVSFHLGENHGEGRYLMINRLPREAARAKDKSEKKKSMLDELGIIELEHLNRLRLMVPAESLPTGDFLGTGNRPRAVAQTEKNQTTGEQFLPVDVHCDGWLRLDLQRMIATVQDNVVLVRKVPQKPVDTLRADQVVMHLSRTSPRNRIDGSKRDDQPLSLTRIVATGNPIVIDVPSESAHVESRYMEFSYRTGKTLLRGYNPFAPKPWPKEEVLPVSVEAAGQQIVASAVDMVAHEDRMQMQLVAAGPGQYHGSGELLRDESVRATWSRSLSIRPWQGQQLLKIDGAAVVESPGMGLIQSDTVELTVRQEQQHIATRLDGSPVYEPQLIPVKLVSQSAPGARTQIQSPRMNGSLERLTVLFETRETNLAGQSGGAQDLGRQRPGSRNAGWSSFASQTNVADGTTDSPPEPPSSFHVDGGALTLWANFADESISQLEVDGSSHVMERSPQGEIVSEAHATSVAFQIDAMGRPTGHLIGMPAGLKMSGMELQGNEIQLSGQLNRVTVPGPGSLKLPLDLAALAQQSGTPGRPIAVPQRNTPMGDNVAENVQPVHVQWQDGLVFDGQTATLHGNVSATGEDLLIRTTKNLFVTLDRRVDFSNADALDEQPGVARITADGGVFAIQRTRDERGALNASRQLLTQDWKMDLATGETVANGPGLLAVTTFSNKLPAFGMVRKPQTQQSSADTQQTGKLTQLSLAFGGQLTGDTIKRVGRLDGDIQGWLGTVSDWDQRVDPLQVKELGDADYRLYCRELFVMESPTARPIDPRDPNSRKPIELQAFGDTYVESQRYAAKGSQIKYAEEKGALIFEGDAQRPAQLWQRSLKDNRVTNSGRVARIRYWPATETYEVEGMLGADLSANSP